LSIFTAITRRSSNSPSSTGRPFTGDGVPWVTVVVVDVDVVGAGDVDEVVVSEGREARVVVVVSVGDPPQMLTPNTTARIAATPAAAGRAYFTGRECTQPSAVCHSANAVLPAPGRRYR
jgi:voltage-gated potassium channel Kch